METKFTKGKWIVKNTPEYYEPKVSTIEIHSAKCDGWICKVQNKGVIESEEGLANAKLIAAAPDLFEALNQLLSKVKINSAIGYDLIHEIIEAEKAIKKATS